MLLLLWQTSDRIIPSSADLQDQTTPYGKELRFAIPAGTFVVPDGDPITATATLQSGKPLPAWIVFDSAEQVFVAKPSKAQAATYRSATYPIVVTTHPAKWPKRKL